MKSRPTAAASIRKNLNALAAAVDGCMLADRHRLGRRLRRLRESQTTDTAAVEALRLDIIASSTRHEQRAARLPAPKFPSELPVVEHRADIAELIQRHQVVVVCGETGSGKSTQLAKICLSLGRGAAGMIGHTQPRRIAARSIAARVASELDTEVGHAVGYKVRFNDRLSADTYIKVMTDGMLLAEAQGDRFLNQYDTLIIDEAHERSLNIDFLLGYLKRLLPKRPELKLIITSATIDPQRFARFYNDAPVIEVSGRTYPVEIRYRPPQDGTNMQRTILQAVDELAGVGSGDVLVFLAGERDIRETAEALRKHHPPHTEILPLYARLSAAEQDRVFKPHGGRRIVLATNVAETSLTVPGIRYVVDPGYARVSRYSHTSKVQRLPVEKISRAAADQRSGRCGRVASGVCIRLYSEDDYDTRTRYTDPEVLRTSLAAVILRMQALKLGDITDFPFLDPPTDKMINDGYRLLAELGAVNEKRELTSVGKQLARLPVDPRIARMLLAAGERHCLREVLIIGAALSVQDPRERPLQSRDAADSRHRQFQHPGSDFLTLLNLWQAYHEQAKHLSRNKLRAWCVENFLSYLRMREWVDIHHQLHQLAMEIGLKPNTAAAEYEPVHRALLTGLLGNIALKTDSGEYQGARGRKLVIFPGSALNKKQPKWIIAAELIETNRVYAATAAAIQPEWVEQAAAHLVRRAYLEPHWEKKRAQVVALEQVTLYGLVIVSGRKVNYGPIDAVLCRELFIRAALVDGDYATGAAFFNHNRGLSAQVEALEHKSRRRDVLADPDTLFAFYDERLPAHVCSGASFEKWRKETERTEPRRLFLTRDYLLRRNPAEITGDSYPDHLQAAGMRLALAYHFEPGHSEDGVTVSVPLAALNQLSEADVDRLVPGLLKERMVGLIKSLPKSLRRHFVPAPDFADACMDAAAQPGPLTEALATRLERLTGVRVVADAWREEILPEHLRMRIRVLDSDGKEVAAGRNLAALQGNLDHQARESFAAAPTTSLERAGITAWDFDELPEQVEVRQRGTTLLGYPALTDEGDSVAIRLFDTRARAVAAHSDGLCRLIRLRLAAQVKYLEKNLPNLKTLCLHYTTVGSCEELKQDLINAAVRRVFLDDRSGVRTRDQFESRLQAGQGRLPAAANELCRQVGAALAAYHAIAARLGAVPSPAREDLSEQLEHLVYAGFVAATPPEWLTHLPRYLKAAAARLDKLSLAPARDAEKAAEFSPWWQRYRETATRHARDGIHDPALERYRWMLEEFRVSLFAQGLKTAFPISAKRLAKQWETVHK